MAEFACWWRSFGHFQRRAKDAPRTHPAVVPGRANSVEFFRVSTRTQCLHLLFGKNQVVDAPPKMLVAGVWEQLGTGLGCGFCCKYAVNLKWWQVFAYRIMQAQKNRIWSLSLRLHQYFFFNERFVWTNRSFWKFVWGVPCQKVVSIGNKRKSNPTKIFDLCCLIFDLCSFMSFSHTLGGPGKKKNYAFHFLSDLVLKRY